jgi:hypothetical protein
MINDPIRNQEKYNEKAKLQRNCADIGNPVSRKIQNPWRVG